MYDQSDRRSPFQSGSQVRAYLLLTLALLVAHAVTLSGQSSPWMTTFGGDGGNDFGQDIGIDEEGSLYVHAQFYGPVTIGSETIDDFPLTHFGLIKYSADGEPVWVVPLRDDEGRMALEGIAFDGSGHYYLYGAFQGTLHVGMSTLTSAESGRGSEDGFIAKYSLDGTPVSAWQMTGIGNDVVVDAVIDPAGGLYVVGGFANTGDFGVETFESTGFHEGFVARVSASMQTEWVVPLQASQSLDYVSGIGLSNGEPVVCGVIKGPGTFGSASLEATTRSGFVAGLTTEGSVRWVTLFDGSETQNKLPSLVTDHEGYAYMLGRYNTELTIDGIEVSNEAFSDSYYLAKFDGDGRAEWARTGGATAIFPWALHISSSGDVIASGNFSGSAQFGDVDVSATGSSAAFLVTFDSDGNQRDVDIWESDEVVRLDGLTSDVDGWLYATGSLLGTAQIAGEEYQVTSSEDGFLVRFEGATQPSAVDEVPVWGSAVSVVPNPCHSCLVRIGSQGRRLVSATMFDLAGRAVWQADRDGADELTIDLREFPSGLYHVRVEESDGRVSVHSVVVQ